MKRNVFYSRQKPVITRPCVHIKTVEGLAYTPSQMNALRNKGIPISNMMVNDNLFDDGSSSGSMEYDPSLERGFNEVDAFNLSMDARKRLLKAHVDDKATFE